MADRVRTFSIPAGTVLKTGFVVPEAIVVRFPYDDRQLTPGRAQKLAGDFALDELEARYGQSRKSVGGFAGVQRATREVNARTPARAAKPGQAAPAPRARGGRKPSPVKVEQVSRRPTEVILRLSGWDEYDVFSAILRLLEKGLKLPRAQTAQIALEAPFNPDCNDNTKANSLGEKVVDDEEESDEDPDPEQREKFWASTAAVTSLEAFLDLYPDDEKLDESICRLSAYSGAIEATVRLRPLKGRKR